MHQVHLFDGYRAVDGPVRARCSCGFLTTPQLTQLLARRELVLSHGLTPLVCDACGRSDVGRLVVGLPSALTIGAHPVTGDERVLCAEGSGGCDLSSTLGPQAAADVERATTVPDRTSKAGVALRASVAAHRSTVIAMAQGVLLERANLTPQGAMRRLTDLARNQDVSVAEAAHRVMATTAGGRRPRPTAA